MPVSSPLVSGVTGLGGYAGTILDLIDKVHAADPSLIRLAAVTSSNPAKHAEKVAQLQGQGVKLLETYEQMLADPAIQAVFLPLPIDLHLPFTEMALKAGKAVFCEKPAAGCIEDVDRMIALRDQYRLPVAIGFQDIYDPATTQMKKLVLDGDLGAIRSASLHACWPRNNAYYGRASWVGKYRKDNTWVLDSPANNALAHFINVTLFILGAKMTDSAAPQAIEAELYRVNPIENYDTCSFRITLPGGVPFLVHLTHACQTTIHPQITITGSAGSLRWGFDRKEVNVESRKGPKTLTRLDDRTVMVRRFIKYVRGQDDPDIALATLEQSRSHISVINGASEASAITTVPESCVTIIPGKENTTTRAIPGIEDVFTQCAASGKMIHESGLASWSKPAGRRDLTHYRSFAGPHV